MYFCCGITEKGTRENNEDAFLIRGSVRTEGGVLRLTCEISAQDPALNPARIPEAIARELPEFAPDFSTIERIEVLTEQGEVFR